MSSSGSATPNLASSLSPICLRMRRAVVVLVDPVAEAHQPLLVVGLLHELHEVLVVATLVADLLEHLDDRLVGAAVQRTQSAEMPALTAAYRLALLEPTVRTVAVEQFCSGRRAG